MLWESRPIQFFPENNGFESALQRQISRKRFPGANMSIQNEMPINKGFSMVEVVISVAIIAAAMLLIMGLFLTMFTASQKGVDITNGLLIANSVMNEFLYDKQGIGNMGNQLYNNLQDTSSPITGTTLERESGEYGFGKEFTKKTVYTYEITCRQVSGTSDQSLKRVDVKVWWWQDPKKAGRAKTGYGELSVTVSRLVYTGDQMEIVPEF